MLSRVRIKFRHVPGLGSDSTTAVASFLPRSGQSGRMRCSECGPQWVERSETHVAVVSAASTMVCLGPNLRLIHPARCE